MTNSVIKTQNIRLLTDKTIADINKKRYHLSGEFLRNFNANLTSYVNKAFNYAKTKVSNKFTPDTMYPGVEHDVVETYGRNIRSIVDPLVRQYLQLA